MTCARRTRGPSMPSAPRRHPPTVANTRPLWTAAASDLFYVPAYCPELSAIEPIWHDTKHHHLPTRSFPQVAQAKHAVEDALAAQIQRLRDAAQGYERERVTRRRPAIVDGSWTTGRQACLAHTHRASGRGRAAAVQAAQVRHRLGCEGIEDSSINNMNNHATFGAGLML